MLHRIENNLYIDNNVEELAMLCEENKIEKTYLDNFIDNAIIYKDRLINNICGNNEISERNVQRVRDILGKCEYDSTHKIAFVLCVNNDELYDEALLYLSDLIVPDGYGVEIIDIRNATSMCSGYNRALKATNAKYKVYIHQDIFVCNKHSNRNTCTQHCKYQCQDINKHFSCHMHYRLSGGNLLKDGK